MTCILSEEQSLTQCKPRLSIVLERDESWRVSHNTRNIILQCNLSRISFHNDFFANSVSYNFNLKLFSRGLLYICIVINLNSKSRVQRLTKDVSFFHMSEPTFINTKLQFAA